MNSHCPFFAAPRGLGQFAAVWLPLSDGYAIMPPRTLDRLSGLGVPMREIARFPEIMIVSRR